MSDSNAGLRHLLAVATELVKALEQSGRREVVGDGDGDSVVGGVPGVRRPRPRTDGNHVQGDNAASAGQPEELNSTLGKLDI